MFLVAKMIKILRKFSQEGSITLLLKYSMLLTLQSLWQAEEKMRKPKQHRSIKYL